MTETIEVEVSSLVSGAHEELMMVDGYEQMLENNVESFIVQAYRDAEKRVGDDEDLSDLSQVSDDE